MSIAIELLERVEDTGGTAWLDGETVRLKAPEPLPSDLMDTLRKHKGGVVTALRAGGPDDPEVFRRVEVFRERLKHHPRWRPFMCLPDVKPEPGHCLSCGGELLRTPDSRRLLAL